MQVFPHHVATTTFLLTFVLCLAIFAAMKNYFDPPSDAKKKGQKLQIDEEVRPEQFYQRGLGLKKEVEELLNREYFSDLIAYLRVHDNTLTAGNVTIHLAREFGFCYGVDRAVEYAYQAREKFPDRRIFITGEIIHNPHVNNRLLEIGIQFLSGQYSDGMTDDDLLKNDVVILPAFGVSIQEFQKLRQRGCVLVDTTCGSVLNVWKRVSYYAKNDYTSVIHGKYYHEETIATSSQALKYDQGRYLIVRDMKEAKLVCDYLVSGGNKAEFMATFEKSMSPNFDPDVDLSKIGVANQTTMLSKESLAIADQLKAAIAVKYGSDNLDDHFQTFDTICSATQERQDAVLDLGKQHNLDLMLVIGGYNSSNTNHLAEISSRHTRTFHIDAPARISEDGTIHHKIIGSQDTRVTENWLPAGAVAIGITAGASTPNNKIGETIERIMLQRGLQLSDYLNRM